MAAGQRPGTAGISSGIADSCRWRGETAAGGESTPCRSHRARAVNRECDGRHGAAANPAKHTFRPRSSTHSRSSSSSTTTATESFPPPAKPARASPIAAANRREHGKADRSRRKARQIRPKIGNALGKQAAQLTPSQVRTTTDSFEVPLRFTRIYL